MRNKLLLPLCLSISLQGMAQVDISTFFLENNGFDQEFNYGTDRSGNIPGDIVNDIYGWTNEATATYTVAGTFAYNPNLTFNGSNALPATGYNGSTGGALGLSTGWNMQLAYTQPVSLPKGTYRLCAAYYNVGTLEAGRSLLAWLPEGGEETNSAVASYLPGTWMTDTITFTLDYATSGKIRIGFEATQNSGSANHAKVLVDYVKLLCDEMDKGELQAVISEAREAYGNGSGVDADDLKTAIDQAQAVYDNENATIADILVQTRQLADALATYQYKNASLEEAVDMTSLIVNPDFEDGTTGWTNNGLSAQSNTSFAPKSGTTYMEKWTDAGDLVGDGSISQIIHGLATGVYTLKAAAQNIQQNSTDIQIGAWIFANNSRAEVNATGEYSLTFTNIEQDAAIGFRAEGATGNWISCDNFRLYYAGGEFSDFHAMLQQYVDEARPYVGQKMQASVLATLEAAIEAAEAELEKSTADNYPNVSTPLREAMEAAQTSIQAYADLQAAIDAALEAYGDGDLNGAETFMAVIGKAQAINTNLESTSEEIAQSIADLEAAEFAYRLENPSGTAPTVVTDKRYARGSIAAFGRMTVSGVDAADILEQGFCYSTEPNPTVKDQRTTKYLENNGRIYVMDTEPATIYYIRAYAITKNYAVGYGDVIKISTLPKGQVTYTYDNGGDAGHNDRINSALTTATTYWSNYTSIQGFNVSCVFSPGTPTADCGYGGNMRIGTNSGQRAGTCMHEMNHGIGGGTIPIWGGYEVSPLRKGINGDWAGDRANEVLRFWENRDDLTIFAAHDGAHWAMRDANTTSYYQNPYLDKYAVNGAHLEPYAWAGPQNWNDTEILYIGNSLINQGFCEDGLIPVNYYSGAFCLPAYVFEQDDNQKYYIKNEDEEFGLYTGYLVESKNRIVKWTETTAGQVTDNDSAAWYITFDPATQYYILRNAATGNYLSYSTSGTNGIRTAVTDTPGNNEKFHLMKSRVDLNVGTGNEEMTMRGYWIIHPAASTNPDCLTARINNFTGTEAVNLYDSSSPQRWLFLKASETAQFENSTKNELLGQLEEAIAQVREMAATPHTEDMAGTDAALENALTGIEVRAESAGTEALHLLLDEVRAAGMAFLANATPAEAEMPFDLTFLMENPAIDSNEGWSAQPTFNFSCCEYFQTAFDFNQTLDDMPAGTYKLTAQAFQRPGDYATAYRDFQNGANNVNTTLYINNTSAKIQHIASEAKKRQVNDDDVKVTGPDAYLPNSMEGASNYFKRRNYNNEVITTIKDEGVTMRLGLQCPDAPSNYWTVFDNFNLYYYGTMSKDQVTAIKDVLQKEGRTDNHASTAIYNLQGIKVGDSLDGLPKGIYIVNRKKVIVK